MNLLDSAGSVGYSRDMNTPMEFLVNEEHITLLGLLYFRWDGDAYDGAPYVNIKRPYGNSDVVGDVMEVLDPEGAQRAYDEDDEDYWDANSDRALKVHREMEYIVQICTSLAGQGELIRPGRYVRPNRYHTNTWVRSE